MSYKNVVNNGGEDLFTIIVETLTGTTFEVKVSPQDTVKSIKTKIQRVEGIPVSHQHLLYNSKELDDSACVTEPTVALHEGATVKLVLSMRGGPISLVHQAVPLNKTFLRNLVKFSRRDEDLPAGCRMAVLVLRVGDQLNLLHVVEDEDDTDSVNSGRLSVDLLEGESSKQSEENSVTMEKVCDLKERMGKLSLQRKSKKVEFKNKGTSSQQNKDASCSFEEDLDDVETTKHSCSLKLPSLSHQVQGEVLKSRSEFSQVPILPDIIPQSSGDELEEVVRVDGATASSQIRPKSCPTSVTEAQFYNMFGEDGCQDNVHFTRPHFRSCVSACASKLRHDWGGGKAVLQSVNILPPISDVLNNHRKVSNIEPRTSQTTTLPFIENLNVHHKNINSSCKLKQKFSNDTDCHFKNSESSFLSKNDYRPEKMKPSDLSKESCFDFDMKITSSNNYDLLPKISNVSSLPSRRVMDSCGGASSSSTTKGSSVDPSLNKKVNFDKKSRIRCAECKKRLSLANMFECRCGFTFCSYHRYSETHHCTYDFKKESRKVLEQANPLVVAPKLPKI